MAAKIIIGLLIAGYAIYLIIRQIKNMKKGNYCGNCAGCPQSKRCAALQKNVKKKGELLK